jgi:hypothetical protein
MSDLVQLHIIDNVRSQWKQIGRNLKMSVDVSNAFERHYFELVNDGPCCEAVFKYWIIGNGTAHYPLTWSGLFNLLRDSGCHEAAQDMMKQISEGRLHTGRMSFLLDYNLITRV